MNRNQFHLSPMTKLILLALFIALVLAGTLPRLWMSPVIPPPF